VPAGQTDELLHGYDILSKRHRLIEAIVFAFAQQDGEDDISGTMTSLALEASIPSARRF
jgi:hypothetical protein